MTVSMCMSSLFVIGTAVLVIVGQCCLDGLWYHTPLLWPEMLMLFASVRIVGICNSDVSSAALLLLAYASVMAAAAIPHLTLLSQGHLHDQMCCAKQGLSNLLSHLAFMWLD